MSPARKTKRKRKPASPPPRGESPVTSASTERSQRLGAKHLCFSCGLKFYDLNKPEPVCPRCGANQREKPKHAPKEAPPPPPPKQPRGRDITPLLAEDDDSVAADAVDSDDADLDIGDLEDDANLFDEAESVDDSDEEDS